VDTIVPDRLRTGPLPCVEAVYSLREEARVMFGIGPTHIAQSEYLFSSEYTGELAIKQSGVQHCEARDTFLEPWHSEPIGNKCGLQSKKLEVAFYSRVKRGEVVYQRLGTLTSMGMCSSHLLLLLFPPLSLPVVIVFFFSSSRGIEK